MLLIGAAAPATATAGSRRAAPDPSPQRAPASAAIPSPDPAPQAMVRSQQPHLVRPPSTPARAPVAVSAVTRPAQSTAATSDALGSPPVTRPRAGSARKRAHPAARHDARTHRSPARTGRVSLSFPLSFLSKDVMRLAFGTFGAGTANRPDGVLLLLSSLAMAALAVASFSLLRRLRRFEGPRQ